MSGLPLSTLSLPKSTLSSLMRGGYDSLQDLSTLTPEGLAKDLNIPLTYSQAVFSAIQHPRTQPLTQSAASLIGASTQYSTLCGPLDRLLQGGLKQGYILELSGPPGCAKEALAANIAKSFVTSDPSRTVLFVDMQNMTSPAALDRLLRKPPSAPPEYKKRVHHLRLRTLPDLMIFLRNLPSYLQAHPETALLVLSSLSFPFQSTASLPISSRSVLLEKVKQVLARACAATRLTVVITSQLATKMLKADGSAGNFDTGSTAVLVPQLGSAYLPSGKTCRVIVIPKSRTTGVVRLLSSPTLIEGRHPPREESYQIIGGAMQ